jgi:hypothetical protein
MFEAMRRKDRSLDEMTANEILLQGEYGVLSTVGENGYPYGVPLSYAYADGRIYFHAAANAGAKLKNMAYCDKVCFTVIGKTKVLPDQFGTLYESVIVFGTAAKITAPAEKQKALEALLEKYSREFRESGLQYIEKMGPKADVFEIIPDQITGKAKRG